MQLVENLQSLVTKNGLEVTIGNFDGVHRGHQDLLAKIHEDCARNGNLFVVVSFVPHPKFIIGPCDNFLINLYEERRDLLSHCKIDFLYEIPFNRDFSTLCPKDFLDAYIFSNPVIKKFYIGHDFAFGANKTGDHNFISNYCTTKNVKVQIGEKYLIDGEIASSSVIRKAISMGDMLKANKLLGRDFFMKGRVIKGMGRGKTIGFPTANLQYSKERIVPCPGVYSSITSWKGGDFLSLTNIGMNPTFGDINEICVETFIFDFDKDIYGEELTIKFLEKIRDEKKFDNVHELVDQIKKDVDIRKGM